MDGWEQQCQVSLYIHCMLNWVVPRPPKKEVLGLHHWNLTVKHILIYYGYQSFQLILKTSAGIDYQEFFQFLCLVTIPRLRDFETATKSTPSCSGSNVCFSELKQLTSKALTCQTFTFLGSCEQPAELVERLHVIHLAARDNLAAVIEGCGSFVSLSVDSEQFPLKGLFSELSEAVSAVVRQNIEDSSGLCMAIRAFELQRIWSVMQELVGSVNLIH